ncbi:Mini-ribonuclease 3 [Picochlorum sp. SENEW3]|nr:Mini-ribonuclease 3 [Picochlorum sp. SENEW3]
MQVCRALSAPQQQRQLSGTGHLEYLKSHVGKAVLAFGGQHRPRCIVADAGKPSRPVEHVLPPAPDLGERKAEQSWNASSLAFLGDSVWELYARRRHFSPPSHASRYRQAVIDQVRAEAQSEAYQKLLHGEILTAKEEQVLQWGKNAPGTLPKRLSAGKVTRSVYREATALECLVGFLYASNEMTRLHSIMKFLELA